MVSDSVASRVLGGVAAGETGGDAQRREVGDVAELTAFVVDQVLRHERGQRPDEEADDEDAVTSMTVTIFRRIAHSRSPAWSHHSRSGRGVILVAPA